MILVLVLIQLMISIILKSYDCKAHLGFGFFLLSLFASIVVVERREARKKNGILFPKLAQRLLWFRYGSLI